MMNSQIILDKINRQIVDDEDIDMVVKVLRSGFLAKPDGGPMIAEFQNMMSDYHSKKHAFAVTSGTASLHCAMVALELKNGDEVIVPALANIADASVVVQEGATPVFVDINSNNFNIDPAKIEEKITKNTRAIIVVHMFGQPAEMNEIMLIAKKHGIPVIEDCAQAAGARYKGEYVGSFGDISCFSLYQTKHIISGEGGMILVNNDSYAKIITSITNNGIMKEDLDAYDYDRIGFNYQYTEIQAALAIGQLNKLNGRNVIRRENVEKYKSLLSDLDIQFQHCDVDTENSYFYLTGLLPKSMCNRRDEFLKKVKEYNVPIKKLYPLALPELTVFKDDFDQDCLVAQEVTKRIFNLYVNPGLAYEEIEFMANAVRKAYDELSK